MIEISVVLVTRNEAPFIIECIQSIEKQFVSKDNWELILVDGMSQDNTVSIAKDYLRKNADYQYAIFNNPDKYLAFGWNIGIREAKGDYIIRPDAHAILYPGYIRSGVKILKEKSGVGIVGGQLVTLAKNFWGDINKEALSSPVGVGNSSFRTGAASGYKDTAVYGIYRKKVFGDVGLFNEKLVKHQDTEFHARILKAGWKIWMDIKMKAGYYCRDSLPKLFNQMFRIGYHLPDLLNSESKSGIQLRHMAPLAFFSVFFTLVFLRFYYPLFGWLALLQISIYLATVFGFSVLKVLKNSRFTIKYLLLTPVIITMHFAYFLGTLAGLIRKLFSTDKLTTDN